MAAAAIPMSIADIGDTNPAAGVIVASPATAPVAPPSIVGFPVIFHSTNIHVNAAEAAEVFVAIKAMEARPLAPSALPALNPNHPNQRRPAPMMAIGRLCGGIGSFP